MSRQLGFRLGKIKGTDDAIAALDRLKPDLYAALVEKMKAEAEATAKAIDSALPRSAPMSGFDGHSGRTSWANKGSAYTHAEHTAVTTGHGNADWPVYRIGLGGYASSVADIAGAGGGGSSAQGGNMIDVLNARNGRASRWVWPVAEKHQGAIEDKMQLACDVVEKKLSARLAKTPGAG